MKCKGKSKQKNKFGRLVEVTCNTDLDEHDIFCHKCGEPTGALSGDLSAKLNIKQSWEVFKNNKAKFFPFSIFIVLTAFLLMVLAIYFSNNKYFLNNVLLLIVVPFVLIPFSFEEDFINNFFTIRKYFRNLKYYPKFFIFTLINILFFLFLKIICTGYFLGITIDPILHLVRLVLVIYWITIVLPAPILMIRKSMNPVKAIIVSYKAGNETRWQQFFLIVLVALINLLGAVLIGLGLLVTIPLSYIIIERYYLNMRDYKLFENK